MRSDAILDRLLSLHPKVIDLNLERLQRLLEKLGNPEQYLPPVIHIAGTNGKGSTQAILRACLEAAGYRVHAYTSPHLVRFHERIRLAGSLIEEAALVALLEQIEQVNDGDPITFFEVTTAAAFQAFSQTPADVVLLEVGLGGRFDATNVIDHPAMTIITPVSHDHAQFLGTDLAGIAAEKAGILKKNAPAVIGKQQPDALARILDIAGSLDIAPLVYDRDFTVTRQQDGFSAAGKTWPLPALAGDHQIDNAATAIQALDGLAGFEIPDTAIKRGLASVTWPARLQQIVPESLGLDASIDVWLDGGHNPDAAEKLAAFLAHQDDDKPVHFITGMLNTKDASGFFDAYKNPVTVHSLTIPGEDNALSAEDIAARAQAANHNAFPTASFDNALHAIPRNARLLICGSLYFAGHVLAELENKAG